MNPTDFTYLLQQPQDISRQQTEAVKSIIDEFPYFQSARALHLKGLKNESSFKYNQELKTTAAYTTDRSILFDFITSEVFTQNQISEFIRENTEQLKDIDIEIEDISVNKKVSTGYELKQRIIEMVGVLDPTLYQIQEEEFPNNAETVLENTDVDENDLQPTTFETVLENTHVDENELQPTNIETVLENTDVDENDLQPTTFETVLENTHVEENELQSTNIEAVLGNTDVEENELQPTNIEAVLENTNVEENDLQPKRSLNISKPLEFNKKESHSFNEWLNLSRIQPIERRASSFENTEIKEQVENSESTSNIEKIKKFDLIEEFISKNPKINQNTYTPSKVNMAEAQMIQPEALMTETLARIYLEQKNYKKAIQSYKILSLKYPEKSSFFANQIKAIEQLQEQNNKK